MKVARYWARVDFIAYDPEGNEKIISLYRRSDLSEADARRKADAAGAELKQRIEAGEDADWYDYQRRPRPEPIEREWFSSDGVRTAAITINRHSIPILNTASLVIVDVDLSDPPRPPSTIARLFGKRPLPPPEEEPLRTVRAWCRISTSRSARLYRTAGGLRYILPNLPLDPASDAAQALMAHLGADPNYARLCKHQRSYRARLAPKPWRIGVSVLRMASEENLEDYKAEPDYQTYLHTSQRYAVCKLIEHLGPPAQDPQSLDLICVHDEMCKVSSDLPLA